MSFIAPICRILFVSKLRQLLRNVFSPRFRCHAGSVFKELDEVLRIVGKANLVRYGIHFLILSAF